MKKILVLMMCCFAMAFASCKPEPEPEPIQEPANQKFLGYYDGTIYLNGVASAPEFAQYGLEDMPIDSMSFHLVADITPGATDETVNVLFGIADQAETPTYETTGQVNGNTINFGDLTYSYVEGTSTFDVTLTLTGVLNGNTLDLSGPATGTGRVTLEGFPIQINLTVQATVDGDISRIKNNN